MTTQPAGVPPGANERRLRPHIYQRFGFWCVSYVYSGTHWAHALNSAAARFADDMNRRRFGLPTKETAHAAR